MVEDGGRSRLEQSRVLGEVGQLAAGEQVGYDLGEALHRRQVGPRDRDRGSQSGIHAVSSRNPWLSQAAITRLSSATRSGKMAWMISWAIRLTTRRSVRARNASMLAS